MAESKLCLICGAVVDASKLAVHRQFHAETDRLHAVVEDLQAQIRRLEMRVRRKEE